VKFEVLLLTATVLFAEDMMLTEMPTWVAKMTCESML
jgi:hypothetical protein